MIEIKTVRKGGRYKTIVTVDGTADVLTLELLHGIRDFLLTLEKSGGLIEGTTLDDFVDSMCEDIKKLLAESKSDEEGEA